MVTPRRLMAILAHPDDETLGLGGALARYAAEGVETSLVVATRGERGWQGPPDENPGLEALGQIRTAELKAACNVLGLGQLFFLDYLDGELDLADPAEAVGRLVGYVRQARPQVVLTFAPDGAYGHPDHVAISQLALAAVVAAADPTFAAAADWPPHRVSKMYYKVWTRSEHERLQSIFGDQRFPVDGVERAPVGWPDWSVTTWLHTGDYWPTVWQATLCHASQLATLPALASLSPDELGELWRQEGFVRVFSLVNGGRRVEDDLFAGL